MKFNSTDLDRLWLAVSLRAEASEENDTAADAREARAWRRLLVKIAAERVELDRSKPTKRSGRAPWRPPLRIVPKR